PEGNGHDFGFHSLYSGYDNIARGGDKVRGGPSIDQALLERLEVSTPFKHIHCGVHAAGYRTLHARRAACSCASAGQQLPCELDLYALYDKVFSGSVVADEDPAVDPLRRLEQRRSILDAVSADLTSLEGRLGPEERRKVDAHLTA